MENKKYDLEKAKEDCRRHEDALEEAQSCMCGHCHECGFDPSEMKAALDEVERLRSENKIISDRAAHHDRQDAKEIELLAARIAELEAGKLMYEEIAESYQICPLCNRLRRRHLGDLCPKHFAERLLARFEQLRAGGKDEA